MCLISCPRGAQTWITQFNLQVTPCLPLAFIDVHQMVPPGTVVTTFSCSLLLIYRPRKDVRLSWPSWLTYSGRFTYISGHPSAVDRAQDGESSLVKDQRSTTVPQNQWQPLFNWCDQSEWRQQVITMSHCVMHVVSHIRCLKLSWSWDTPSRQ